MSRRKVPTCMADVRKSRACYTGAITKATAQADNMPHSCVEEIADVNLKEVDKLLNSLKRTETNFTATLDEAQEFSPEGEADDAFQEEEETVFEHFEQTVTAVRDKLENIRDLKNIQEGLADLTHDMSTLQTSLASKPDCDHSSRYSTIDASFADLRIGWRKANLPRTHPLKGELDACTTRLDTLAAEIASAKYRSIPATTPHFIPSTTAPAHKLIELPKIKVPTFSGDIMTWSTFWSTFQSTVHNRTELDDSQKLNYLRQSIKDPTLQLLLNTPMETPDTYTKIIKELKERFQKTREIHQALVKTIITAKAPKYSRAELRLFHDIFTTALSNLEATKFNTIESFLSSHVYALLPPKLQLAWDQAIRKDKGVPPVNQLLDFLKEHAETLPADSLPAKQQPASDKGSNNSRRRDSTSAKPRSSINVVSPAPSQPPVKEYRWECKLCPPEKHQLYFCPKWVNLTLAQKTTHVNKYNLCSNCLGVGHSTANCRSRYRCRDCGQKHHSSLHQPAITNPPVPAAPVLVVNVAPGLQLPETLLTTAEVLLQGPNGEELEARALIDSGAGISLVTNKVATLLNLPLEPTRTRLAVAQGKVTEPLKYITTLQISPRHNRGLKLSCTPAVAGTVTAIIPPQPISSSVTDMVHLIGLHLADTTYNVPGNIDIILGTDMIPSITSRHETPRIGKDNEPIAQSTVFGWTLTGPVTGLTTSTDSANAYHHLPYIQAGPTPTQEPTLDTLLSAILQEDEGPKEEETAPQEEPAEANYQATTKYLATEQRYEVSLPRKESISRLGASKPQAVARYLQTDRAAHKRNIRPQFQDGIRSYITLGHAEEVPPEEKPPAMAFYLPMHSVLKLSSTSTKLRVVFDGSAVTTTGLSLNQALHVGTTLQATLSDTLLKFRSYNIALNADISKMYREVQLCPEDRDLHRFVWREDPASPLKDYRMKRVTFGVSASPFLAVRTLHQTAVDHGGDYPRATQHILESFYVDDFLGGADSTEEAIQLFHDLRSILRKGGFDLRKWRSSSSAVMNHIPEELQESNPLKTSTATHISTHSKALGLRWDSQLDVMSPAISADNLTSPTRRGLVSAIFKTYDVLGWMAPALLQMKLLIQGLWRSTEGWDDVAPDQTVKAYLSWEKELPILAEKTIPRRYTDVNPSSVTLHGFADASKAAYGAVVYYRATYPHRSPTVSLVVSKTKLVKQPTKKDKKEDPPSPEQNPNTIPKLELCAALLLAKLLSKVGAVLGINSTHWQAWSDSSTVLAWLDGNTRSHPVYVANRVKKTLELTKPSHWLHVPTECNPADCASRGISPTALFHLTLWWEGPTWLQEDPIPIPRQPPRKPLPDARLPVLVVQPYHSAAEDICQLPYTYPHLIAITAWVLRFRSSLKERRPNPDSRTKYLTGMERREAERWMLQEAQRRCFQQDLNNLSKAKQLSRDSKLKALNPFLKDQLIRVGGRLSNSAAPESQTHPIIADARDPLIVKYLEHLHTALLHCGPSLLLAFSGKKFHIIGVRKLTRKICAECVTCKTYRPRTQHQLMANLPSQRVNASPPFTHCGMDFAGPFKLKMGYVRRPTILDSYICVFICLATKAIHLEVTSDQSTEAFEAALHRFVSRRGCPQHLYSDNGGSFVGARNKYNRLQAILKDQQGEDDIRHFLATQHSISWHNIPAFSPHMGGLWEAAVKSMKTHLRRVMGVRRFTFEQLTTLTCQIEACLNSRPLIPITSHDPDGLAILTSGHFLTTKSTAIYPEDPTPLTDRQMLQKWNVCQGIVQQFWTRWHKEYLNTLQARTKWQHSSPNLKVEDIVAIRPGGKIIPGHWPLGRVIQTLPGTDGRVRAVIVKTKTGVRQRAVTQLALIHRPGEDQHPRPGNLSSQDLEEEEDLS